MPKGWPAGVWNGRLLLDTILIGVVSALSAWLYLRALVAAQGFLLGRLAGFHPPALPGEGGQAAMLIGSHGLFLVPVVAALGGLAAGFLVYGFAGEAQGHGINTVVRAYHSLHPFLRALVVPATVVAAMLTLGSGGSGGLEGPAALINAGLASIYGSRTRHSEAERRLLILVGLGASMGAIFHAPVAGALFAVDVVYNYLGWEAGALFHVLIGSAAAAVAGGLLMGWQPFLQMNIHPVLKGPLSLLPYLLLGLPAGLAATLLPAVFSLVRRGFRILPVPRRLEPALGGLGVGLLGLAVPQIIGGGYGWLQRMMLGQVAGRVLLVLVFAKMLAFSLTVGSGGTAGAFGPSLFVGAALGGYLAGLFGQAGPPFVAVGMVAVLAGAARVPFAAVLLAPEMTGDYRLFVPAALAVATSYLVQVGLSSRVPFPGLYEAQAGRADQGGADGKSPEQGSGSTI